MLIYCGNKVKYSLITFDYQIIDLMAFHALSFHHMFMYFYKWVFS